jgi:hypothetical protein
VSSSSFDEFTSLNIAAYKGLINGIFFKSFTSSRAESSTDVTSYFSVEKIAVRFQKRQFRLVPSSGPTAQPDNNNPPSRIRPNFGRKEKDGWYIH